MSAIPLKKGERTVTTTVRLPESDFELIQARAKHSGIKFSEYVRRALLDYESLNALQGLVSEDISSRVKSIMAEAMGDEQEGVQ